MKPLSQPQCAPEHRFELRPSRSLFIVECGLQLIVLATILALPNTGFKAAVLLLWLLAGWKYFRRDSQAVRFAPPCSVVFNLQHENIRWHCARQTLDFPVEQLKVRCTRWFVLLQLGRDRSGYGRQTLLLADSFYSPTLYSRFRRILMQIDSRVC
jgi:hypothetical protein